MITIKQVEAVYWVEKLGSFHAAADKLYTTQSSISKRVKELEAHLGFDVFDRTRRATQITLRGRELLPDFARMLSLHQNILEKARGSQNFSGEFRLGVTEMVALTWLSRLISAIRVQFPNLVLKTSVEMTERLIGKLAAGKLDLAICPGLNRLDVAGFSFLRLNALESAWMCSPRLVPNPSALMTPEDIVRLPLLAFEGSMLHMTVLRALRDRGIAPREVIECSSMIALAELVGEGMGAAFLPREYFLSYGEPNRMWLLHTTFPIPPLEYAALYRDGFITGQIAELAREHCDFSNRRRGGAAAQAGTRAEAAVPAG